MGYSRAMAQQASLAWGDGDGAPSPSCRRRSATRTRLGTRRPGRSARSAWRAVDPLVRASRTPTQRPQAAAWALGGFATDAPSTAHRRARRTHVAAGTVPGRWAIGDGRATDASRWRCRTRSRAGVSGVGARGVSSPEADISRVTTPPPPSWRLASSRPKAAAVRRVRARRKPARAHSIPAARMKLYSNATSFPVVAAD